MPPPPRNSNFWQVLRTGPLKVFVIGGGNWGTVVGKIAAENVMKSYLFSKTVSFWIYKETLPDGQNLVDVINKDHENVKYLPGIPLPPNLVGVSDFEPLIGECDLIVFVLPHQFVPRICAEIGGKVKPSARAISLVKGLHVGGDGQPQLISSMIEDALGIPCCAMSGANVALDIARGNFSETTLGYTEYDTVAANIWQQLFDQPSFKVNGLPDIAGVEVCGAVKNVIAVAAGFCDGLGCGTNTKAAIIRLGVDEMKKFAMQFFNGILEDTFFDSAGYADVITTCFGGRNVRCAAEFVRRGGKDSWEKVEAELLHGQKMQGQLTTAEVFQVISANDVAEQFPLFCNVYAVAFKGKDPKTFLDFLTSESPRPLKTKDDCCARNPHSLITPPNSPNGSAGRFKK